MTPELRAAVARVKAFTDKWPGDASDPIMGLTPLEPPGEKITLRHSDLRALLAAIDAVDLGPEALCIAEGCPHCPDGHRNPNTRPWSASMSVYRDRDRQPTHLIVAPSAGGHVAESDAEWLRQVIRDAKARYRPLTDEPCGVIPTPAGLDYLAHRRQQHPRTRP